MAERLGRAPRVYLAHPVTCYGTDHETACIEVLADLLPGVDLCDPAACFASSAEWLAAWPGLVGRLDGLVVFADTDGTVGAGVLREVADAVAFDVPVAGLDLARGLCWVTGFELLDEHARSGRRCAIVSLGDPLNAETWLAGERV